MTDEQPPELDPPELDRFGEPVRPPAASPLLFAPSDDELDPLEEPPAFDDMDRRLLTTIIDHYNGGPVGIETLAAALSEPRDTLEDVYEPYLIQQGLLARTPRGRAVTEHAYNHLGLEVPKGQSNLF